MHPGTALLTLALLGASPMTAFPIETAAEASHVGSDVCGECHGQAYRDWKGSNHDLAMQEATEKSVVGDFDGAAFTAHGVTSRFFRRNGEFFVRTEGPTGALRDYRIDYTFGVYPLQ